MIDVATAWIVASLAFLVDWSLRWDVVLTALALWFALRPPRRAAIRHAMCAAGLAAGLLLPVVPRWGSAEPVNPPSRTINGVILDLDDKPVPGAVVVGGLSDTGTSNHQTFTTDGAGRFSWPIPAGSIMVSLFAHKPGRAPIYWTRWLDAKEMGDDIELRLPKANSEPFVAVLVDGDEKPVVGAGVRIEMLAHNRESKRPGGGSTWLGTGFVRYHREILGGSPLESLVVTATDEHGAFSFGSFGPDSWLRLAVTTRDGREMRVNGRTRAGETIGAMMAEQGFVSAPDGKETQLVVYPAARVQGRVVTKLPGVSVSGLKVALGSSWKHEGLSPYQSNFGGLSLTDADGRFTFDGLNEGTVNVYLRDDAADAPWTYRAAQDVELKPGWTKAVRIELIRGVEAEGRVFQRPGEPLKRANLGMYGPLRPRSGGATIGVTTDDEGRYRYRLPPGETRFYVMGHPPGNADRTVVIPDGSERFEVPPIVMGYVLIVRGRVTDAAGRPVSGATVVCVGERSRIVGPAVEALTDSRGAFQLPSNPNNSILIGKAARLQIRLRDGSEHEATAVPEDDGSVTIKLSVRVERI